MVSSGAFVWLASPNNFNNNNANVRNVNTSGDLNNNNVNNTNGARWAISKNYIVKFIMKKTLW